MPGHRIQLLSLQSDREWPGNTGAVLEAVASLLWNTSLGTRGELVHVQGTEPLAATSCSWKGRAALPVTALGSLQSSGRSQLWVLSCPLMSLSELERTYLVILGQLPVAFPAEMPFEILLWAAVGVSVLNHSWAVSVKVWPSCFGTDVGQGWQEEPHSHSGFISEKGRASVLGVTFLWDVGCLQKAARLSQRWVWKMFLCLRKASWVPDWQKNKVV